MEVQEISKISTALEKIITDRLYQMVISKPLTKTDIRKITIRPVMLQNQLKFQEAVYRGTQVFHENLTADEMKNKTMKYFREGRFGQLQAQCKEQQVSVLMNRKGTVTVKTRKSDLTGESMQHDRVRNYILPEGEPVDFLIALGVETPDGKVVKARYDKFRQINRYLEFVRDILPALMPKKKIRIVDFGCGKSYLTFALYYYLRIKLQLPVEIIGLDLKKDVIEKCNQLSRKLGYDGLAFFCGDIKDYDGTDRADMVVTLHACDTATDYAIAKAVHWGASVILTVPCCQHELNKQIKARQIPELESVLQYSLIKERMAALVTDAYRANCLEKYGYDVQVMEFIDMEHTPKNILIRAVKSSKMRPQKDGSLQSMDEFWKIEPTLEKLLLEENEGE